MGLPTLVRPGRTLASPNWNVDVPVRFHVQGVHPLPSSGWADALAVAICLRWAHRTGLARRIGSPLWRSCGALTCRAPQPCRRC